MTAAAEVIAPGFYVLTAAGWAGPYGSREDAAAALPGSGYPIHWRGPIGRVQRCPWCGSREQRPHQAGDPDDGIVDRICQPCAAKLEAGS